MLPGQLVIWSDEALAVLNYRCMLHGIAAPDYWQTPPLILQTRLSRHAVPVREVARWLGLPVVHDIAADKIWDIWLAGGTDAIRACSASDALHTYVLFLRFQHIQAQISEADYHQAMRQIPAELL